MPTLLGLGVGIAVIVAAFAFELPVVLSIALIVFAVGWLGFAIRDRVRDRRQLT